MVKGYENSDIDILDKPDDWEEKVGIHIPDEARQFIISSPAKRCVSTAKLLFDRYPDEVTDVLGEFDCKNLGTNKFWEITEAEFNKLVHLPATTMAKRAMDILTDMGNLILTEHNTDSVVAVSHGMVIRYLYHLLP
jgi:broad specificity phosphatase PhoE